MRWLRSPREIAQRLRQEIRNLILLANPPVLHLRELPPAPLAALFDPGHVADFELAAQIRQHRFPLLGLTLDTGSVIAWRRDYLNARETGTDYLRLIPYLDFARAGDHKLIWELNRHQHLVVLARAYGSDRNRENLDEIIAQLRSWFAANPFQRGINWASALEVAFRALSWLWVYHLVGDDFPEPFRREFLQWLCWHGCHLETNLSFYFSPNTHLLGEAVALHALGVSLPQFPASRRWSELGRRVVREQMEKQVRSDGAHFEQSTYYHVYALDMFRFHARLEPAPPGYLAKVTHMEEFLEAVMGPAQRLPFLGDDDGGRLFHPYGPRAEFGRDSLTVAGRSGCHAKSRLFPDAGIAVMREGAAHVVIDAGPFGPWSSGHSHSDTLSLIARTGAEDILIDPGTYTYTGDAVERNWFRGSAAHNTIRIDGSDQAVPAGPFGWIQQPRVAIRDWTTTDEEDRLDASCEYGGFVHRRQFRFIKPQLLLLIVDEVSGPPGEHVIEQFWHTGSNTARARLILPPYAEEIPSWASSAYGEKHPSPAWRAEIRGALPRTLAAGIMLGEIGELEITIQTGGARFEWKGSGAQHAHLFELSN